LGGGTVFIDTEDTFALPRVLEIAHRFGIDPQKLQQRSNRRVRIPAEQLSESSEARPHAEQFHLTLIRFSQNPFLIKAVEDLRLKSYPFSYYYWRSNRYLRSSLADHNRMIQALRNRDFRLMDRLIGAQLNNSKSRYLKYLAQT
jgi:DNA-binding GntR family transcriptional regulator